MVVGNIALVQVQATVAAFIVSLFSMGVGTATSGKFHFDHALLMTSSAMFTATSSCFVLGELFFPLKLLALITLIISESTLCHKKLKHATDVDNE